MIDAPERIFAVKDLECFDGSPLGIWDTIDDSSGGEGSTQVEYVRADLVPQWQPIETAPKDGTKFDAWCVHSVNDLKGCRFTGVQMRGDKSGFGFIVHLLDGVQWQYLDARDRASILPRWIPTHWMPLQKGPDK